jgi:hypothetical protein
LRPILPQERSRERLLRVEEGDEARDDLGANEARARRQRRASVSECITLDKIPYPQIFCIIILSLLSLLSRRRLAFFGDGRQKSRWRSEIGRRGFSLKLPFPGWAGPDHRKRPSPEPLFSAGKGPLLGLNRSKIARGGPGFRLCNLDRGPAPSGPGPHHGGSRPITADTAGGRRRVPARSSTSARLHRGRTAD